MVPAVPKISNTLPAKAFIVGLPPVEVEYLFPCESVILVLVTFVVKIPPPII